MTILTLVAFLVGFLFGVASACVVRPTRHTVTIEYKPPHEDLDDLVAQTRMYRREVVERHASR